MFRTQSKEIPKNGPSKRKPPHASRPKHTWTSEVDKNRASELLLEPLCYDFTYFGVQAEAANLQKAKHNDIPNSSKSNSMHLSETLTPASILMWGSCRMHQLPANVGALQNPFTYDDNDSNDGSFKQHVNVDMILQAFLGRPRRYDPRNFQESQQFQESTRELCRVSCRLALYYSVSNM